jgi:hypothetical protein
MVTVNDKVYLLTTEIPYEGAGEHEIFAELEPAMEEAYKRANEEHLSYRNQLERCSGKIMGYRVKSRNDGFIYSSFIVTEMTVK